MLFHTGSGGHLVSEFNRSGHISILLTKQENMEEPKDFFARHLLFGMISIVAGIILACASCTGTGSKTEPLTFQTDRDTVLMGRSVSVTAHLNVAKDESAGDYLLLPYVNQRRWGSHEFPDSNGNATFLIPLPNPGTAEIQIIAVKADSGNWMGTANRKLLMVGNPIPDSGIHSSVISVAVKRRNMPEPLRNRHLFVVQWEPWFIPGPGSWTSAEAVPVVGFYDSYNEDVIRQHILWFIDIGVTTIMPDWSNHIWSKKHWNEI